MWLGAARECDDKEVIAEDHEPRRKIAGEPGAASALHDVERGREQNIAAESENDRGRVKRPQPSEIDEGQIEIEPGKSQLESNVKADGKAGDAPKHRRQRRKLDRPEIVVRLAADDRR